DGIVSNGANVGSFTKYGAGTVVFSNAANNFGGDVVVNGGVVQGGGIFSNSTPFGTNANSITLNAGTLNLRSFTNASLGPGLGYHVVVASNATINVDRSHTNFTAQTISIGKLDINNVRATVTGGNSYRFTANDTTTISKRVILALNGAQLTMAGRLVESVPGSVLIKEGQSNLFYTSLLSATHTGGTIITNGSTTGTGMFWRPVNGAVSNAGAYVGFYSFGSAPITLDGNATFGFQPNVASNYTFTTPFIIADRVQGGGVTNDGGGTINDSAVASTPVVTNTGAITLSGTLRLSHSGSVSNMILAGPITITGADREITILARGAAGNDHVLISGNITNDGTPRNLTLRGNAFGAVELSGSNSNVSNMYLAPSYVGNMGRVRFLTSNSVPLGTVTVETGVAVAIGFNTTNFNGNLTNGISGLNTKFIFKPESILALEGTRPQVSIPIDLSPAGLNADVRLAALEGAVYSINNPVIPFANVYRLGGGNAVLTMSGTNQLTGANSLSVNPNPFMFPILGTIAGTVDFNATVASNGNNTYTGGTVVNAGTLNIRSGRNMTPLGTGPIDVYGTFQALGVGSLAGPDGLTNNNVLRLQPAATLVLGETGSFTNPQTNRFGDNVGLTLNSARLNLVGRNISNAQNSELIGDLTYALGSRVNVNNSTVTQAVTYLTVNNLIRSGNGTLELIRTASNVTNDNSFGASSRLISTIVPPPVNGMLAPNIVAFNDVANNSSFVTYNTNVVGGFAVGIVNAAFTSTSLSNSTGTDIVDLSSQPTNLTILDAPATAWALRSVTNGIRGNVDVTLGSGGLIIGNTSNDVRFVAGSLASPIELSIFNSASTTVMSNDFIAAGITKFGPGTMTLLNNRVYSNGWNLNWGTLNVSSSNALGTQVAGNFVNLNNGQNTVNLTYNQSADGVVYTSGPITSKDNNIIAVSTGAAGRTQTIAPMGLTLDRINNGPLGSRLLVQMNQDRTLARIGGDLTLNSDAYLDTASTLAGRISGSSNRLDVAGNLVGSGKTLTKLGIASLGLTNDNSATWTGGTINVNFGALHAGGNKAFGDAASVVNIRSNAVLQLANSVVNFTPLATVNQADGSVERWLGQFNRFNTTTNAETFSVPASRIVQVADNMLTATNKTIRLQAGATLEGYQFIDDSRGNSITLGLPTSIDLASNAKIGQSGVDIGRAATAFIVNSRIGSSAAGGGASLTKIGLDTLVLTASNTFGGGLNLTRGTVLVGNGIIGTNATAAALFTNGFATGTGDTVVYPQAMLGGTNGAVGGNLTVQSGGTLMGGIQGTVGTNAVAANLTFAVGSIFDIDINATNQFDEWIAFGDVNLGGVALTLRVGASIPNTATNVFVLIDNRGPNPVSGSFAGLADGSFISFPGGTSDSVNSGFFQLHVNDPLFGSGSNDVVLTVAPPPQALLAVSGLPSNGVFTATINGGSGRTFSIQASTNLQTWVALTNVFNATGTVQFSDPDVTNYPQRFYRTVWVP
ncbi:MAG TPA: autotransporter-associated beta strand repeat-containing protein, partial [Verrucomicrobiae bacterium]